MKKVAVFFGGQSVEHDVSIITGALTVNSIDKTKYDAIPVYVTKDGLWFTGEILKDVDQFKNLNYKKLTPVVLKSGELTLYAIKGKRLKAIAELSVAINCLHGERGEDGSLAGLLNLCSIPLASAPMLASSVCMDKCFTKIAMKGLKVKTLPSVTVLDQLDIKTVLSKLKFPMMIKPACLGSSIGVQKANSQDELISAVSIAKRYGEKVIIEPCLSNFIEINCAAYKNSKGEIVVSECERPIGKNQLLSFEDKYKSGKRIFPADIDLEISDRIKAVTKRVYSELFMEGVVRIDYFVCDSDVYLNEINTVPGSLSFYLFGDTLKSFSVMLDRLLERTITRGNRLASIQKNFKTSILNMGGIKSKNACKK